MCECTYRHCRTGFQNRRCSRRLLHDCCYENLRNRPNYRLDVTVSLVGPSCPVVGVVVLHIGCCSAAVVDAADSYFADLFGQSLAVEPRNLAHFHHFQNHNLNKHTTNNVFIVNSFRNKIPQIHFHGLFLALNCETTPLTQRRRHFLLSWLVFMCRKKKF